MAADAGDGDVLKEAVGRWVRGAVSRGRREVDRARAEGRARLEERQMRRDLDELYRKLGREVIALVDGGEIEHPGVRRGAARIQELEARLLDAAERRGPLAPEEGGSGDSDAEPDAPPGDGR